MEFPLFPQLGRHKTRPTIKRPRFSPMHVQELKNSKYALGKNEQNLTERQRERLSMIQSEDGPLARGHRLKERLKAVFALKDPDLAEEYLDKWIRSAQHCRIAAFVELQRKIRRHRGHILNTIRFGLSNARIEATNNKIKLLLRIAYGFHNIDTMISLVMLFCSSIEIPCPGRKRNTPVAPAQTGAECQAPRANLPQTFATPFIRARRRGGRCPCGRTSSRRRSSRRPRRRGRPLRARSRPCQSRKGRVRLKSGSYRPRPWYRNGIR